MALIKEFDTGTPIRLADRIVTLVIDGERVSVPAGTSVMAAAMTMGTKIPKLCATDSLEPFGSFFGVQKASEPVHIMMTQDDFRVMLVNHTAAPLKDMKYRVRILNLDGSSQFDETAAVPAAPASRGKATTPPG